MQPDKQDKKTEVLYGVEDAVGRGISFMNNVLERMDISFDNNGPSIVVQVDAYRNGYIEIRRRGAKIRAFTEVTKENLGYCKELIKIVDELRHLDGVKGGIAVNGKEYMATTLLEEGTPLTQVIYSNEESVVKQGQYIFDTFWNIATPAEEKIRNIEQGITADFIKTIVDPIQIQQLGFEIANMAKEEILVLFSTANAFHRQERAGGIKFIRDLTKNGIRARILTPMDDKIVDMISEPAEIGSVEIRNIEPVSQTKVTILIVDRKYSLSVELKDDSQNSSLEAIGLATYSNSRATVLTYASFFNSLWRQTELYDQLIEREEMQREFINTAAHELRTPIQPIIGLSDILYRQESDPEKSRLIEVVSRNATRLHSLTENLLNVARIEAGALPLQRQIMDAAVLVKEAVEDARKTIGIDKINLEIKPGGYNFLVDIDSNGISQVLYNLLNNANKFTKEGTITVKVEQGKPGSEQIVIISVRDRGHGIDPNIQPRLFTKFASKSENGLGLGLFIAKGIIDAHGGKIWAMNNEDRIGATFAFSLPIAHRA